MAGSNVKWNRVLSTTIEKTLSMLMLLTIRACRSEQVGGKETSAINES
jgi:hypothetical protein